MPRGSKSSLLQPPEAEALSGVLWIAPIPPPRPEFRDSGEVELASVAVQFEKSRIGGSGLYIGTRSTSITGDYSIRVWEGKLAWPNRSTLIGAVSEVPVM